MMIVMTFWAVKKRKVQTGMIVERRDDHDRNPKHCHKNVRSQDWKCGNDRNYVAECIFYWVAIHRNNWNWCCELVVHLVNMFVYQFVMQKSMWVIEQNFLRPKTYEKFKTYSRKTWKFSRHLESKPISQVVNYVREAEANDLISNHHNYSLKSFQISFEDPAN